MGSDDTTKVTGSAYGRTFALEVPVRMAGEARLRLPFGWLPSTSPPERSWYVRRLADGAGTARNDEGPLAHGVDLAVALDVALGDLELWVAEHAVDLVFVHAGCVVWRDRAIAIPGRTLAGKSAFVSALVQAGATYYSDEYTVINAAGMIHPYARMLSLRPPEGAPARRVAVEELGGRTGTTPVPLALVAHIRYAPQEGWSVRHLTRGGLALALLDNTVPAQARPTEVMDHLQAATCDARGVTGTRGDAREAAQRLLSLIDA